MTAGQRFLLLLILVGALATVLGLVSRRPNAALPRGVVLMSLLVQGGLMAPVTEGLRIEAEPPHPASPQCGEERSRIPPR